MQRQLDPQFHDKLGLPLHHQDLIRNSRGISVERTALACYTSISYRRAQTPLDGEGALTLCHAPTKDTPETPQLLAMVTYRLASKSTQK